MGLRYPVIILTLLVMACSGAGCTGSGGNPGSPPAPVPAAISPGGTPAVTIELTAAKMAYDQFVITVPAGAAVVVHFHNREDPGSSQVTGIAHNFAVYDSPAAQTKIFSGAIITGGQDITYRFTAPAAPGTYFFRCDVHPSVMKGTFIVR
jgi:plastocyanin